MKLLTIQLETKSHDEIKILAAKQGISIKELVIEALIDLLKKHKIENVEIK